MAEKRYCDVCKSWIIPIYYKEKWICHKCGTVLDDIQEIMVINFGKVREILEFKGRNKEAIQFIRNILLDSEVEKEE